VSDTVNLTGKSSDFASCLMCLIVLSWDFRFVMIKTMTVFDLDPVPMNDVFMMLFWLNVSAKTLAVCLTAIYKC